jgi:hypothetical protein
MGGFPQLAQPLVDTALEREGFALSPRQAAVELGDGSPLLEKFQPVLVGISNFFQSSASSRTAQQRPGGRCR